MPLTRLSLEERIRCVRFFSIYEKTSHIQKAWKKEFGTDAPSRKTIVALNKKFNETGSVADLSRSGRPKTSRTAEKIALVEATIKVDPNKSIRNLSNELGLNKAAVHRIKQDVDVKKSRLKTENKILREKVKQLKDKIDLLQVFITKKEVDDEDVPHSGQTMSITLSPSSAVLNPQVRLHLQPVQVLQVQQHSDITQIQTQEINQIHINKISHDSLSDCTMYRITTAN